MASPRIDRCPTCHRKYKRSNEQNRRYWLLLHAMADKLKPGGRIFSADTFHVWARSKWLGCTDHVLPNGRSLSIPKSTRDLDVAEFNEYMTEVEAWANDRGVFLEDMEQEKDS